MKEMKPYKAILNTQEVKGSGVRSQRKIKIEKAGGQEVKSRDLAKNKN